MYTGVERNRVVKKLSKTREIEYIIIINVIYALTVIKIQKIELLVIT